MSLVDYFVAEQIAADQFGRIVTKKDQGGDGVNYLIGFRKDGSSAVQSIHFAREHFSVERANEWLAEHKMKSIIEGGTRQETTSLSFDKIFHLVQETINSQYPPVPYDGEQPYEGASRYRIARIWSGQALARKTIWSAETDPIYYLFPYSIEERNDTSEVTLGDPKPMKLQIIATDGSISLDMESAAYAVDEVFEEAGKRNAKKDAKAMNYAIRCMVSLMDDGDFEDETVDLLHQLIAKKSQKPISMQKENNAELTMESWNGLAGETLNESFLQVIEGKFDDKNLIIRDMVILGPVSKNGYRYPKETQAEARPLFEGAKAYLNHPTMKEMGEARRVQDLIGEHRNIRVMGEKTYSDLHLLNNPTVKDYVLPIVQEGKSHLAGNSVVIRGTKKKDDNGVEYVAKIHGARSVDLVAEPATTNGLFESQKFNNTTDDKTVAEEKTMEWTDISLESLRKERPDLVETLLAGDQQQKKMVALEAENIALKEQNSAKDKELVELKEQRKTEQREMKLVSLMAESKIPDSVKYEEGTKTIKPHFRKALETCVDEDGMKEMIGAWEATFPAASAQQTPKEKQKVVAEAKVIDFGTKKQLTESAILGFAKAV